ncbi:MAG: dihydrodipicolinate synthase family protein [Bacteroidota bacterium]
MATTFTPITGLIAAPFTPMDQNGELNLSHIPAYAAFLRNKGVSGVFVAGTTGEGLSLTLEERMALAEAWVPFQAADFQILVHVGANALGHAQQLARHAGSLPIAGMAQMLPGFFAPASPEDLLVSCQQVAKEAPQLPFFYYHLPGMTRLKVSIPDFVALALERIPNFAGLKFTEENLVDVIRIMELLSPQHSFLFGVDEIHLAALGLGIKGAVGSTYNYLGPGFVQLRKAWERGDHAEAKAWQVRLNRIILHLIAAGGGVKAGKYLMELASGLEMGPCRLPLGNLTEEEKGQLAQALSGEAWEVCTGGGG